MRRQPTRRAVRRRAMTILTASAAAATLALACARQPARIAMEESAGPGDPEVLNTSKWYVYEGIDEEAVVGTALDVSTLLDKPAGKHGRVVVDGDRYVFEDGVEVRFWGTNITAGGAFPEKSQADQLARELARMGVNCVRFHHMDAPWATPNIFGNNEQTTRELDPEMLDRFEYFWAQLKENGIYVYLDALVHRSPRPGDDVAVPEDIKNGFKIEGEFDPHLIELQKEFTRQLLTHRNPYTGTMLAEDPCLAMMEVINEDSLLYLNQSSSFAIESDYYQGILKKQFNEWLLAEFENRAALQNRWDPAEDEEGAVGLARDEVPELGGVHLPGAYRQMNYSRQRIRDTYRFLYETQEGYYREMIDHLRSIGVKCLITGSNHWLRDVADTYMNSQLDYLDRHTYWAHPRGGFRYGTGVRVEPGSMLFSEHYGMIGACATRRTYGKPYIITEWQASSPNQYRAEGMWLMAAYGAMQNWSALQFNYTTTSNYELVLSHVLDVYPQPGWRALWPTTALLFHRGDIRRPGKGYYMRVEPDQATDPFFQPDRDRLNHIALMGGTGLMYTDIADSPEVNDEALWRAAKRPPEVIVSVTGELSWDRANGLAVLNTARSQGFAGFPSNNPIECRDVEFRISTDFACVLLSSLTDDSIEESNHVLLTAVARARPKGMVMTATKDRILDPGGPEIIVEPVEGELLLRGEAPKAIYRLSPSGQRRGEVATTLDSRGRTVLALSAEDQCMHYEIVK